MGRYDWYPQASVECISSDNKGTTLRVKCYFTNNSWNYSMYMTGYVTFNGTEYQVLSRTNVDTTGVSQNGGVVLLGYKDFYVARQTTDVQCTFSARIYSDGGYANGDKSSSSDTYAVNALEQYSISYNANGGYEAPASQTKYYGIDITLSSTTPSKTGYTFLGWATSSTATSATIQPGANYSSNASVTYYAVWKINTWTVSYNTNGGSGAPANQTKTYGINLTLSSTIPTKTGHTFKGWATSKDGSVAYQPNGTYSENAAVTLYAVWEINTWTVSYNANGGSGDLANQTKTYGIDLILSSTIPTRNLYIFKGWATSEGGSVSYEPGATYTLNANLVLYAVWELAYISPSVLIETCYRIDSNGDLSDDGSNAQLTFTYNADRSIDDTNNISKATVYCKLKSESNWTTIKAYTPNNQTGTLTCDNFETAMGTVSPDEQYDVKVTVEDTYGKTLTNAPYISTATTYISIAFFTMDFLAGGHGIAFGKPSKNEGFECGMNATFDGNVAINGDVNCSHNLTVGSDTKDSIVTVNGDVNCSNGVKVTRSSGDTYFRAERTDTGKKTYFGIESGGENRGIWDGNAGGWTIHRDADNNIFVGGKRIAPMVNENTYWGLKEPDGGENWIRTTKAGLLPSDSTGTTSSLGNSYWPFKDIYTKNMYINGIKFGEHNVLWSGAWYMNGSQTATLSEAVSAQPNGIVLVFSRYQDGVEQNWGFEHFFVPKYVVATHAAQGSYFSSNQNGRPWSKYIYISDTELKGNNDNTNNGEFDGRYLFNDYCVLRYVIGV